MIQITVFTPSYNRAQLLPRLYESLKKQTFLYFEWVVVDDGSDDDTEQVVKRMIADGNNFPIRYFKKQNGGKHTAINYGAEIAEGELFFIADSDDMLPPDALTMVALEFDKIKNNKEIGAVVGYDKFLNSEKEPTKLPFEQLDCNFVDFWQKWNIANDMKEVFRTSVLREIPFPEVEGEKFCPEELEWLRISHKYKNHYFNKMIYIAEYQEGGLTSNIIQARMNSPVLATWDYAEYNEFNVPFRQRLKNGINYWRFYSCVKDKSKIVKRINPLWIILKPIGYLMHLKDKRRIK